MACVINVQLHAHELIVVILKRCMLHKAENIFHEARSLSGEARDQYLAQACGNDLALWNKVEILLTADSEAGSFLAEATNEDDSAPSAPTMVRSIPAESAGRMIDRFKLLQLIGEGGFGTVWMAEQKEPVKRRVALKIIKLGMDTKQVIARFEAERQALAMMDHPNIAKVLDAGATETGRPYFVMELVKGIPMIEFCDSEMLDTKQRLELFKQVCNAIQHAHMKGIIHRDIKPSNVLVTLHDGEPVVKVIDFGIAKATSAELTQKTLFTEHRQMIGTPAYMSPEQAAMSGLDIDTRSDVYSLGVLLYELLTGTTPFDTKDLMSAGFAEMMRIIRETEPHKPSTRLSSLGETGTRTAQLRRADPKKLRTMFRGDLDWIVMKCLEKDRSRRYDTANGLTADIQRHLTGEPVVAAPPSRTYRVRKFIRRNTAQVVTASVIAVVLVLGIIGTSLGMVWAVEEKQRADHAALQETEARQEAEANEMRAISESMRAERRAYAALMVAADGAVHHGEAASARRALAEAPEELRGWEWSWLDQRSDQSIRTIETPDRRTLAAAMTEDGRHLLSIGDEGILRVLDAHTGEHLRDIDTGLYQAPFSFPDDASLVVVRGTRDRSVLRAFDWQTEHMLWETEGRTGSRPFSPDGTMIAVTIPGVGLIFTLESRTGRELARHHVRGATASQLQFNRDGSELVYIENRDRTVHLVDAASGEEKVWQPPVWGDRRLLDAQRDRLIVSDHLNEQILIYDIRTRELAAEMDGDPVSLNQRHLSGDGRTLVGISRSRGSRILLEVFDLDEMRHVETLLGHDASIFRVAFTSDDRLMYSTDRGGNVRFWDAPDHGNPHRVQFLTSSIRLGAAFSPNGHDAACGGWGDIQHWNMRTGQLYWDAQLGNQYVEHLAYSPDGSLIAATEAFGEVVMLSAEDGTVRDRYSGFSAGNTALAWTPDGETMLLAGGCGRIAWIDAATGERAETLSVFDGPVTAMALSHDGTRLLATSGSDVVAVDSRRLIVETGTIPTAVIIDVAGRTVQSRRSDFNTDLTAAAFSPDDSMFAVGDDQGRVLVYGSDLDAPVVTSAVGHRVISMTFNPAGDRLAVGSTGSATSVIELNEGTALLNLEGSRVLEIAFLTTPEGREALRTIAHRSYAEYALTKPSDTLIRKRALQRQVRRTADDLYRQHIISEDILAHLETRTDLAVDFRQAVIDHVRARGDHIVKLRSDVLVIARDPHLPALAYESGLRRIDFLEARRSDPPQTFTAMRAIIYYRLGEFDTAMDVLSVTLGSEGFTTAADINMFSAGIMIEHARGNIEHARELLRAAQEKIAAEGRPRDQTARMLFDEATLLLK